MKYISKDRLCDFKFHDSEWSFVSWENGNLTDRIEWDEYDGKAWYVRDKERMK